MKERFPGFQECMRLMRKHDAQLQEDGFYFLLPHAHEYVEQLIDEFSHEADPSLRCRLLELHCPRDTQRVPPIEPFHSEKHSPMELVQKRETSSDSQGFSKVWAGEADFWYFQEDLLLPSGEEW